MNWKMCLLCGCADGLVLLLRINNICNTFSHWLRPCSAIDKNGPRFRSSMLEAPRLQGVRLTLIARFMGPTWGPTGADRTQVGPMLAPWTLLSGTLLQLDATTRLLANDRAAFLWKLPYDWLKGLHQHHIAWERQGSGKSPKHAESPSRIAVFTKSRKLK